MTAKMIVLAASAFLSIGLLGTISDQFSGFENAEMKLRVVSMSAAQWQIVKNQVNTNGWYHIKDQNVLLVITNGCSNIERLLPIFPPKPEIDLERNPLKIEGRRGKDKEPMPYQE